jgi:hypothetical protein
MIHFMTVHFHSEEWIDIQLEQIKRHTAGTYKIWACLNGIAQRHHPKFDRVFDLDGEHPEKLNVLAQHVRAEAQPDDLLVFIDGDAFPIADWVPAITELLTGYPLVAVRRDENLGDYQPHPCFCVTTAGFWKEIEPDWSRGGRPWINAAGFARSDAGGKVLTRLEDLGVKWYPLLRTNKRDLHPVLFAVYGDLVYHHGCGFRTAGTHLDSHIAGVLRWRPDVIPRWVRPLVPILSIPAKWRRRRRERHNAEISQAVFAQIRSDVTYITRFFLSPEGDDDHSALPRGAPA